MDLCTMRQTGGQTQRDARFGKLLAECQDREILRKKQQRVVAVFFLFFLHQIRFHAVALKCQLSSLAFLTEPVKCFAPFHECYIVF